MATNAKGKRNGRHGRLLTIKEIKRIRKRGYEAERELVKKLRMHDFRAVRIPVSAPSREPLPDVFATKGDCLVAFEVKAPRAERAYFQKKQVEKLFRFLDLFEPYSEKLAVLAAKFPYKWVFKCIDETETCIVQKKEKSNFKLTKCS